MEGRYAAPVLNMRNKLPLMCAASFALGASIEYIMCVTGFYHVHNVKQGQREAMKERESDDFWVRVNAKRLARQQSGKISD
jgi:hypothetical protein